MMKKLLAVALVLCLLVPCAVAESIDLSGLSFDDLRILQQRIAQEMVTRPEWKGTKVPKGVWVVGEDIPAGYYAIELQDRRDSCFIGVWGFAVNDYSTNGGLIYSDLLYTSAPVLGKIELRSGWVLEIGNPVILKPVEKLAF